MGWYEPRYNSQTFRYELVEFTDNGATETVVAWITVAAVMDASKNGVTVKELFRRMVQPKHFR